MLRPSRADYGYAFNVASELDAADEEHHHAAGRAETSARAGDSRGASASARAEETIPRSCIRIRRGPRRR